jgi:hypothetical protein
MRVVAVSCGVLAWVVACDASHSAQSPAAPPSGGTLVWQDEFDGRGLPDTSRWDYEVGLSRNNERQYYTRGRPENARLENGMLVIEAHREPYEGADR